MTMDETTTTTPATASTYTMPSPRPRDDADFITTDGRTGEPITARCVAAEFTQAGNGADVLRLLMVVCPGEKDHGGADVGGRVVIIDKYLSEAALAGTIDVCRFLGSETAAKLATAIKTNNGKAKAEHLPKLLTEISTNFAASGLTTYPVRFHVADEKYTPKKGPTTTSRRAGFVNPVPKKTEGSALNLLTHNLLATLNAPKGAGASNAQGAGSSPPPAVRRPSPPPGETAGEGGEGGEDDIPF